LYVFKKSPMQSFSLSLWWLQEDKYSNGRFSVDEFNLMKAKLFFLQGGQLFSLLQCYLSIYLSRFSLAPITFWQTSLKGILEGFFFFYLIKYNFMELFYWLKFLLDLLLELLVFGTDYRWYKLVCCYHGYTTNKFWSFLVHVGGQIILFPQNIWKKKLF